MMMFGELKISVKSELQSRHIPISRGGRCMALRPKRYSQNIQHARSIGHNVVIASTTQKRKSGGKKSKLPPLPNPKDSQQTLQTSFTIGGVGLHSGDYAFVRVRPAFAGEGRYFVRVPPGTNASDYQPMKPKVVPEEKLDIDYGVDVGLDPEVRAQAFLKYLEEQDKGYDGDFGEYLQEEMGEFGEYFFSEMALHRPNEDPMVRDPDEETVLATIEAAESYGDVTTILRNGGFYVMSPEGLLSALEACGVDNARIEIEGGSEVPIGDGSSLGWVLEIQKAGLCDAPSHPEIPSSLKRRAAAPNEVVSVQEEDGSFVTFYPGMHAVLSAGLDKETESTLVGRQWFTWKTSDSTPEDDFYSHYRWKIAPSREIFSSIQEVQDLFSDGLLRGGPDGCCIIADGDDWCDPTIVRFAIDEGARQKIRSIMGIMSLCAIPGERGLPVGHIVSYNASTGLQLKFAQEFSTKIKDLGTIQVSD